MRGGTANCSVVISDERIGAPVVTHPDIVIAMNRPSMEKFEETLKEGQILLYNKSLIDIEPSRKDISSYAVNASDIADNLGNVKLANVVARGAILKKVPVFKKESVV
jgi:2-oxoglutarate ferredoxin oxidoreductase subunit gamma